MSKPKRAKAVRESDNFDYDFSFELDGATLEILPTKARGGSIEKKLVKLLSGDWPSEERLVQRLGGTWGGSTAPTDDPTVKKVYVYTEGRSPAMRQRGKASKATLSIQESPSYRQVLPTFYQGEVDENGIFEMYFQAYNGMGYSIADELTLSEVLLKLDGYLIRAEGQGREVVGSSVSRGGEVTIEISYPDSGVGDDEGYLIVRPDPRFAKCESCGDYVRRSEIGRDNFGFDSCESCRIRDAEDEERFDDFEESQDSMYDMIRAHSRSKVREAYDALDQNQSLIPGSEDYYREPNPVEVFQSLPTPLLGDGEWSQREFFPALKSLGWTIDYMDFQNEGSLADWDEVFYHAHPDSGYDSDYALYKNRTTGVWGLVDGVYDSSFVLIPPKDGIRYVESKKIREWFPSDRRQKIYSWFQSLPRDIFGPYYWWIDNYQEEGVWLILNPEPDDMVWAEDEPTPNEEVVSYVLNNCPVPLDIVNVQRTTSGTRDFIFLPKEVVEGKRDIREGSAEAKVVRQALKSELGLSSSQVSVTSSSFAGGSSVTVRIKDPSVKIADVLPFTQNFSNRATYDFYGDAWSGNLYIHVEYDSNVLEPFVALWDQVLSDHRNSGPFLVNQIEIFHDENGKVTAYDHHPAADSVSRNMDLDVQLSYSNHPGYVIANYLLHQGFNDRLYPGTVESKRLGEGRRKQDPIDAEIEQAAIRQLQVAESLDRGAPLSESTVNESVI